MTPRCEHCGAEHETLGAFGTHGRQVAWQTPVGRADVVLGHKGYLCTPCWWRAKGAAA
jgi:hypothetical protein